MKPLNFFEFLSNKNLESYWYTICEFILFYILFPLMLLSLIIWMIVLYRITILSFLFILIFLSMMLFLYKGLYCDIKKYKFYKKEFNK